MSDSRGPDSTSNKKDEVNPKLKPREKLKEKYGTFKASEVSSELRNYLECKPLFLNRNYKQWKESSRIGFPKEPITYFPKYCVFDLSKLYIIRDDDLLYKRKSLVRAKTDHEQLTRKKTENFNSWAKKWEDKNLTGEDKVATENWFLGKNFLCKTKAYTVENSHNRPYFSYRKYSLESETDTTHSEPPKEEEMKDAESEKSRADKPDSPTLKEKEAEAKDAELSRKYRADKPDCYIKSGRGEKC